MPRIKEKGRTIPLLPILLITIMIVAVLGVIVYYSLTQPQCTVVVSIYDPHGNLIETFDASQPLNLLWSRSHAVYVKTDQGDVAIGSIGFTVKAKLTWSGSLGTPPGGGQGTAKFTLSNVKLTVMGLSLIHI